MHSRAKKTITLRKARITNIHIWCIMIHNSSSRDWYQIKTIYTLTSFILRKSRAGRSSPLLRFRHFLSCNTLGCDLQRGTIILWGDEGSDSTFTSPSMLSESEEPPTMGSSIERLLTRNASNRMSLGHIPKLLADPVRTNPYSPKQLLAASTGTNAGWKKAGAADAGRPSGKVGDLIGKWERSSLLDKGRRLGAMALHVMLLTTGAAGLVLCWGLGMVEATSNSLIVFRRLLDGLTAMGRHMLDFCGCQGFWVPTSGGEIRVPSPGIDKERQWRFLGGAGGVFGMLSISRMLCWSCCWLKGLSIPLSSTLAHRTPSLAPLCWLVHRHESLLVSNPKKVVPEFKSLPPLSVPCDGTHTPLLPVKEFNTLHERLFRSKSTNFRMF